MTQVLSGNPAPRGATPEPDDVVLVIRGGRLLVRFVGEIDTALRGRFDHVLGALRAAREPVDVDCREVTFFGAEGVRMLVLLLRAAGGPGVVDFAASPPVERVLRLTGVDPYPLPD